MAYVPKDWVTGEVITEQALDHIEQGIANIVMVVTETVEGENYTLNKTWREIDNALANGVLVKMILLEEGGHRIDDLFTENSTDGYFAANSVHSYETNSADGYPVFHNGGGGNVG